MVLNTEWALVEIIELINDGTGLAFGIIGGRSSGVIVKTIIPGGVADRDGRLQSGDHILQIGEVNLRGLGSEQVASVLRQCGVHVRMVVARPMESGAGDFQMLGGRTAVVPTKVLGDQLELERHLADNNCYERCSGGGGGGAGGGGRESNASYILPTSGQSDRHVNTVSELVDVVRNPLPIGMNVPNLPLSIQNTRGLRANGAGLTSPQNGHEDISQLPETEEFSISISKGDIGLGITVAGYVCEKEEISGIFVKSISKGGSADLSGQIRANDRILRVDGRSVIALTNHQAVEILRGAGGTVCLQIERYLRGPKYDQLQQAIKANELCTPSPPSPSLSSLPRIPLSLIKVSSLGIEPDPDSYTSMNFDSTVLLGSSASYVNPAQNEIAIETIDGRKTFQLAINSHDSIVENWTDVIAKDAELIIAEMEKDPLGGLGISLEGTVDVEDGVEVRPHHYIRSILPIGPVGKNNILQFGDELLEVNGVKLFGLTHVEVVAILKQLPSLVVLVCVRSSTRTGIIDTGQCRDAFQARNLLTGSISALIPRSTEKLVKAKSDTSIVSSIGSDTCSPSNRSKSLEIIAGLPMWSEQHTTVQLHKGDHGLGFSILDYQDPLDASSTVIVIRSLVPGGVAQADGRLIPGDRLLSVNGVLIDSGCTLDRAVQHLKAAPCGLVVLNVAKPISGTNNPMTGSHKLQSDDKEPSTHSQDTDMDDQTCLEDFHECIEEYQECLETDQYCIEDDTSQSSLLLNQQRLLLNHAPFEGDVTAEYMDNNNQSSFISKSQQQSESDPSFKSINGAVVNTDSELSEQIRMIAMTEQDTSEKEGYDTCQDEVSMVQEDDQRTPTNSIINLNGGEEITNYEEIAEPIGDNDETVVDSPFFIGSIDDPIEPIEDSIVVIDKNKEQATGIITATLQAQTYPEKATCIKDTEGSTSVEINKSIEDVKTDLELLNQESTTNYNKDSIFNEDIAIAKENCGSIVKYDETCKPRKITFSPTMKYDLKSYDDQAGSLEGDEFFLVPVEHKKIIKCLSEPAVLESNSTLLDKVANSGQTAVPESSASETSFFTYRINEYYNDIKECMESTIEQKLLEKLTQSAASEAAATQKNGITNDSYHGGCKYNSAPTILGNGGLFYDVEGGEFSQESKRHVGRRKSMFCYPPYTISMTRYS